MPVFAKFRVINRDSLFKGSPSRYYMMIFESHHMPNLKLTIYQMIIIYQNFMIAHRISRNRCNMLSRVAADGRILWACACTGRPKVAARSLLDPLLRVSRSSHVVVLLVLELAFVGSLSTWTKTERWTDSPDSWRETWFIQFSLII